MIDVFGWMGRRGSIASLVTAVALLAALLIFGPFRSPPGPAYWAAILVVGGSLAAVVIAMVALAIKSTARQMKRPN
jgi:hypothetical protein